LEVKSQKRRERKERRGDDGRIRERREESRKVADAETEDGSRSKTNVIRI
jgi:hypothetical protein